MAQTVKISDEEMEIIRAEASLHSRSVAGQITHWLRIGRAIERSDRFDYGRVRAALEAELSPDELTAEEQETWFAELDAKLADPAADADIAAAYAKLSQRPGAAGYDDEDNLVIVPDGTAPGT